MLHLLSHWFEYICFQVPTNQFMRQSLLMLDDFWKLISSQLAKRSSRQLVVLLVLVSIINVYKCRFFRCNFPFPVVLPFSWTISTKLSNYRFVSGTSLFWCKTQVGYLLTVFNLFPTAVGLACYVETLLRKSNTEFNVCYLISSPFFCRYKPNWTLYTVLRSFCENMDYCFSVLSVWLV